MSLVDHTLQLGHSVLQALDHVLLLLLQMRNSVLLLTYLKRHLLCMQRLIVSGYQHFELVVEELALLQVLLVLADALGYSKLIG